MVGDMLFTITSNNSQSVRVYASSMIAEMLLYYSATNGKLVCAVVCETLDTNKQRQTPEAHLVVSQPQTDRPGMLNKTESN